MKTINELTEKILDFRNHRDWQQFHKPKDVAAALAIESGELQEHFLWKSHEECDRHIKENKDAVAEEMADVGIYLMLMASDAGIDLGEAIETKLKINEKRYPADKAKGSNAKYTYYSN